MKNKKDTKIPIFLLVILTVIGIIFLGKFLSKFSKKLYVGGKAIKIEVAFSTKDKMTGLSGRKEICRNCGMLFVFSKPGKYAFWMKEMKFDLDLVWIEGDKIVGIDRNISRNSDAPVIPQVLVDKVLETQAGLTAELNIQIEDKIRF